MKGHELWAIAHLCVTLATSVYSKNIASKLCGDETGHNCLYQSNKKEMVNVPIHFDKPLPSWLTGTLVRNGVGLFESGTQSVTHVFDGFAKLSSWKFFPNGTAVFSTRFVASNFYKTSIREKRISPFLLFSTPNPEFGTFEKAFCLINGIDNMNFNIFKFSGDSGDPEFGVFTDALNLYRVSIKNLSTIGLIKPKLTWRSRLFASRMISAAHPLPEPGTTNRLTFLGGTRSLDLIRMTSLSGRELIAQWNTKGRVPYMHSFSVTKTRAILLIGPFILNPICHITKAASMPCIEWSKDRNTYAHIVDLTTGDKRTIIIRESVFALRHINAYDVGRNEIIIDIVSYHSPQSYNKQLNLNTVKDRKRRRQNYEAPTNKRIYIYLGIDMAIVVNMTTSSHPTADSLDMPCINELYQSKDYCFVYGINGFDNGKHFTSQAVLKKNMCNGGRVVGSLSWPYHYPSEPFFVANPKGVSEDDGVLLVPFLHGKDVVTYLAVINATTMSLVTKADAPTYVPFSIHGRFVHEL